MYGQLFVLLLLASQIISNASSFVGDSSESVEHVTPMATRPTADSDGYVPFPDVHASYKLYEERAKSWFAARDRCIEDGAHLVVADTVQKIQYIRSLITKFNMNKWVHVGIYHMNPTDKWVRADNDHELTDIPWLANNPDGTGDCAGIAISLDGLLDYQCQKSDQYFACERVI